MLIALESATETNLSRVTISFREKANEEKMERMQIDTRRRHTVDGWPAIAKRGQRRKSI